MAKLNLTQTYKSYFTANTQPEVVFIEPARFISIPGKGDPSEPAFAENIQALYITAYTIKFAAKQQGNDFVVSKLEGLWWLDESKYSHYSMAELPLKVPRSEWQYRLLIRMPEFVTQSIVEQGKQTAETKNKLRKIREVDYFEMTEGKCVQMLHIGPFSTEPESLAQMLPIMQVNQFVKNGLHHEIYLSDFRKTEPGKLKTILREPVK